MGRGNSLFNKWCWDNWIFCKRIKLDLFLTPHTKINLNCIIDLNVRAKTIEILEKSIEVPPHDLNQRTFLMTPKPKVTNEKSIQVGLF